jgi:hypothetical protein
MRRKARAPTVFVRQRRTLDVDRDVESPPARDGRQLALRPRRDLKMQATQSISRVRPGMIVLNEGPRLNLAAGLTRKVFAPSISRPRRNDRYRSEGFANRNPQRSGPRRSPDFMSLFPHQ